MTRALLLLGFLVALPAAAAAQPASGDAGAAATRTRATYSFDSGGHVRWLRDTSATILGGDEPLGGARLTLGRSLTRVDGLPLGRALAVGVFARWVYASTTGQIFETLDTGITQNVLTAGVRIDAPIWWRFRGIAQAELGMARTAVSIRQDEMAVVDDHAWAPIAAATLGADFALYDGDRLRIAIGADLGYVVTVPVDLRALPEDRPDPELSVPTTFASIGKLDTRGYTYQGSLRISF